MYYRLENRIPIQIDSFPIISENERRVGKDTIGDVNISTVFLGIDHSYNGGTPVLFETMIFGGENDQYKERYTSWEEAEKGHKRAVEVVKTKVVII